MRPHQIKKGEMYSDGKEVRTVISVVNWHGRRLGYASSVDNFVRERFTELGSFAHWAKFPCELSLELEGDE
jgi:hypothetical protein